MPGLTIDQLYEAYMDIGEGDPTPFAEDVWELFGRPTGFTAEEWAADWGMYLPTYDPAAVKLAERTRDLDYQKAADILDITSRAANRVYATEADTLSTKLGTELGKAREVSGRLNLRSGSLESAVEDTLATSSNKVKDLGDRLMIQKDEDKNTYNASVVDATLDFDKAEHETKKELYNRTLAAISKLTEFGAFAKPGEEPDMCCSVPTMCSLPSYGLPGESSGSFVCGSTKAPCGSAGCEGGCYEC
jgi:hypothetical protein